jgi:serine phosphatase RsbU (regulator of sigma subunit)
MAAPRLRSIQQTVQLLAVLNGIVVLTLWVSAWRLLREPSFSQAHARTTIVLAGLLVLGAVISYRIVFQRVIRPLERLVRQSDQIASTAGAGLDQLRLAGQDSDEVVSLTRAFNGVLRRQREALQERDRLNRRLREINRQVDDSIRYAALLQRSILPDRQLQQSFGEDHLLLWLPRDTVGGDYYVCYDEDRQLLVGVADCAGHGVPGAMMTMLARAAFDRFVHQMGVDSPAALLEAVNAGMDQVLSEALLARALATSMDVGLVMLDRERSVLRFAGARIALYWSDGSQVQMVRGGSRSLWERRRSRYADQDIPIRSDVTYYLVTDGLLDQAGGEDGFALGGERFGSWLVQQARRPLAEQEAAFREALLAYRGSYPQRDDITLLAFRLTSLL